jgi:circadian clock protein KaiC
MAKARKNIQNSRPVVMPIAAHGLEKSPTGIQGLDEITGGGLPKGRPTLVCGGAGSGKTILAMEFLVRGARQFNEPGVFMAFEETEEELTKNAITLGFDLNDLIARKKLVVDYVYVERSEIEETGEYDLDGLFVRLENAIDSIGAKRVVLDTVEALFAGLANQTILRAELRRLFRWLKAKGVTAVITGERGKSSVTRYGLEEYVADCVILLDHTVKNMIATRHLRVAKYRGARHGTDEQPFLIDQDGISVLPISSLRLDHQASLDMVSTGIDDVDAMMGGKGYYRGSSVLISGTSGTGKTSFAASFVDAASRRGEKSLYFAFEESPMQLVRNMRSVGIDLEQWVTKGLLQFHAARPSLCGLEMHLATTYRLISEFRPSAVVIDPISNLGAVSSESEIHSMVTRLIDYLKTNGISGLFTNLTRAGGTLELTEASVSSLMDTWLLLRDFESNAERNRVLYVLKSRGMAHSNQLREFRLTDSGIQIIEPYIGPAGVLTGTARLAQETRETAERLLRDDDIKLNQHRITRKRTLVESQIAALRAELAYEELGQARKAEQEHLAEATLGQGSVEMQHLRGGGDKGAVTKMQRQAGRRDPR